MSGRGVVGRDEGDIFRGEGEEGAVGVVDRERVNRCGGRVEEEGGGGGRESTTDPILGVMRVRLA